MDSLLTAKKDSRAFEEKLASAPESTQRNK